jgi:hypothetical protein
MEWAYSTHECDEADRASHCSIGDNKFCPGLFHSALKILVTNHSNFKHVSQLLIQLKLTADIVKCLA